MDAAATSRPRRAPRPARNLLAFQRAWRPARDAAFDLLAETAPDGRGGPAPDGDAMFEALRAEMAAANDAVLADLPRYFDQFRAAAERAGATVVEAVDAEAANAYVASLAASRGAQ